jgi:hypothetical protein
MHLISHFKMNNNRLLVLDINGVLCCKMPKNSIISEQLELLELKRYTVIMRPGYREFLDFCYDNFTVAFFSSTTYSNANAILDKLLSSEQKSRTAFRWVRGRTHFDPDYLNDSQTTFHDTIKKLSDIFDNPIINDKRKYNESNTILCDDSEVKTRFNEKKNIIIFKPFEGDENDNILFEMMKMIPDYFENLG